MSDEKTNALEFQPGDLVRFDPGVAMRDKSFAASNGTNFYYIVYGMTGRILDSSAIVINGNTSLLALVLFSSFPYMPVLINKAFLEKIIETKRCACDLIDLCARGCTCGGT